MNLKADYQKFKKHLRVGGLLYAIWRGIKYFAFLVKRYMSRNNRNKELFKNTIAKGKLKLIFNNIGISIYWDDIKITQGVGLNSAINTLGLWTDSSKADWRILERGTDYLKFRVWFHNLPITQIWSLCLESEQIINWQIEMEVEEDLHIDERRVACVVPPQYKTWVNGYEQADFPQIRNWQDMPLGNTSSHMVGVRFPIENVCMPSLCLEFQGNEFQDTLPFIQNTSYEINAHILGTRIIDSKGKDYYLPSHYRFFSGKILLFENDASLDKKIEELRQESLQEIKRGIERKKNKTKLKILLVNLPWQRNGRWGVRAGSRWPHIKDESEGNYLPFPFFLAYATSLLHKHEICATLIDATAEQIPEDKFIEKISRIDFDLLVAETSTPSFLDDLKILKKVSSLGIPLVLCGPHIEIYQPEFLQEHPYIDFVLFGEYEFTLLELIKNMSENKNLSKIDGLIWRNGNEIIKNQPRLPFDINLLPWPYRQNLPMQKYLDAPGEMPTPSVQMLARRGCPFKCIFCLWPQVLYQGNHYRVRQIEDVISEMEYLVREKEFKSVYFDDDTFNIGKERMLKFCQVIKERNLQNIPWAIMARSDLMDEEILTEMKSAGLRAVKYGVESFCQPLIESCHKNMDLVKSTRMIEFTKSLGIKVHLTFCFGFSGETKETIQRTIDYGLSLDPDSLQFSILTPFPGTSLFEELDKQGRILTKDWSKYDGHHSCVFKPDNFSPEDLEKAKMRAYRLWREHQRRKRGFRGDIKRFGYYLKKNGFKYTLHKTFDYLNFIWLKRKRYLNEDWNMAAMLRLLKDKFKKEGIIPSILRILSYLKSDRFLYNYLDILGVFNGSYAFKGPNTIQIDLTDYCNNNCIACWCNSPLLSKERLNKPRYMLPTKLVKNLIAEASHMGTREIYFSGGGEPFMHPDILDIIQHAKKLGITCAINTNFTLIDEEIIHKLIDLRIDNLTVSVWSGTANIYKTLHPNKDEKDFYRIRDMLYFLNSKKDLYPYVKIYNVICNMNYHQMRQMIDFAQQTKSEFVEFTVVDTIPNATDKLILSEEQRKVVLEQCNEIKRRFSNHRNNHNPEILNFEHFLRRISNLSAKKAEYDSQFIDNMLCYVGWLFARIMPNGDVNPCLKSHRFPVGNIHQQSFKKIWNSKKQAYFRKKTLSATKDDPFFALIGNDPNCKIGCYKSCDDISRNISMHNKIQALSIYEKFLLKTLGRRGLGKLVMPEK